MNRSQAQAITARIKQISDNFQLEHPADQLSVRKTTRVEDGLIVVEVDGSIVNPDQGFESGWFFMDAFVVGPRGKIS